MLILLLPPLLVPLSVPLLLPALLLPVLLLPSILPVPQLLVPQLRMLMILLLSQLSVLLLLPLQLLPEPLLLLLSAPLLPMLSLVVGALVPPLQVSVHASQAVHPVTLQLTRQKPWWHSLQPFRTGQLVAPPRELGALTSLVRPLEQFFEQAENPVQAVLQLCASLTEGGVSRCRSSWHGPQRGGACGVPTRTTSSARHR